MAQKRLQISINEKVIEVCDSAAESLGMNRSQYITMLIMNQAKEDEALRIVNGLTDEQLQQVLGEQVMKKLRSW